MEEHKTEDYIVFDCCVGLCEPIRKGNINNIYYICSYCENKQIKEDEEIVIKKGYVLTIDGDWIKPIQHKKRRK
jgi:hypothetical protein